MAGFKRAVLSTTATSSMVLLLAVTSNIFGAVFARLGTANWITESLLALPLPPVVMLILVLVLIFLLGWPFEWPAIILVFLPIFYPVMEGLKPTLAPAARHRARHADGLVRRARSRCVLQTAYLSPPVAMSAYYLKQVVKEWSLGTIYKGMFEFMMLQCVAIALIVMFPKIATTFPEQLRAEARRDQDRGGRRQREPPGRGPAEGGAGASSRRRRSRRRTNWSSAEEEVTAMPLDAGRDPALFCYMPFDFDTPVDRAGTWSTRWERYAGRDVIPLWVADTDFRAAAGGARSAVERVAHGVLGYTTPPPELRDAIVERLQRPTRWRIDPAWIVFTARRGARAAPRRAHARAAPAVTCSCRGRSTTTSSARRSSRRARSREVPLVPRARALGVRRGCLAARRRPKRVLPVQPAESGRHRVPPRRARAPRRAHRRRADRLRRDPLRPHARAGQARTCRSRASSPEISRAR